MGKGDRKTRRGKLFMGSYGVRRKKRKVDVPSAIKKSTPKTTSAKTETSAGKESKKPSAAKKTTRPKSSAASSTDEKPAG